MPASTTREMTCNLYLLTCVLAGQGCDTDLPNCRQEWLHGRKHLMTVSCVSPEQQRPGRRHCRHAWLL